LFDTGHKEDSRQEDLGCIRLNAVTQEEPTR
jgi:hypothetical protein